MKRFFTYSARYGHGIEAGLRYLFVILFVYAGMSKLLDFETFQVQLAQSPLLSAYAGFVAWAVPLSEFLIAILLLIDRTRVWGLSGFFFLMVMFTTYIIIILNFADFVPCSCGGVLEKMSWGQHLVFNVVFVLISGLLLFFQLPGNWRRRVLILGSQIVLGVGVVSMLFAFSEKKMHRNNAFVRRYPHHPVKLIKGINIKYNSYYFAGVWDNRIYLGNVSAPAHIINVDTGLVYLKTNLIELKNEDSTSLFAPRVIIDDSSFLLIDGHVPVVYGGNLQDLEAQIIWRGEVKHLLSQVVFSPPSEFVFRTLDANGKKNVLGMFNTKDGTIKIKDDLLKVDGDGIFDTDGMLLYNSYLNQFIYVYYYRNQFVVADSNLDFLYTGRTVDTVKQAVIKVAATHSGRIRTLTHQPAPINRESFSFGKYLLIKSDRLGKFEPEEMLEDASIIDVYNLKKRTYEFSFYLYNYKNEKINSFVVHQNLLFGLTNQYLVVYRLQSNHFDIPLD